MSKSIANTELLNTINLMISHNSWDTVIRQTFILIDGNPKTIVSYLNSNLEDDAKTTDIQLNKSNVLDVMNLVYSAFKCEYASSVRDLLNFFFEHISLCETYFGTNSRKTFRESDNNCSHKNIIATFIGFKQIIGKIIFNLFNFMDLSQHLKLSDQTFLKSLMSINLFLCYHQQHLNDIDNATTNATNSKNRYQDDYQTGRINVLKTVVVQLKDLVDHFRCKNCFVGHGYFNDFKNNTNNMSTRIPELSSKMNKFNDVGLQNDLYKDNMFDPEHLLVKNVFEINENHFKILQELYDEMYNSYDINDIFKYQKEFLSVSVNTFLLKSCFQKSPKLYSEILKVNYNIPETFLSDSYMLLIEKKTSALSDNSEFIFSKSSHSDKRDLSDKILKLLNSNWPPVNELLGPEMEEDIFSMTDFVISIVNSTHFKSFLQTMELFKQESNANDDYNLLTMDAYSKLENHVDGEQSMETTSLCMATAVLRKILVSISLLINVMEKHDVCIKGDDSTTKEQCFQDNLRLHLNSVFQCISNLIGSTSDKKLHQMLWPILFHLENMGWIYHDVNDDEAYTQYVTIHQYLLMTLGSIERYELSNCKSPIYNQALYYEIVETVTDTKTSKTTPIEKSSVTQRFSAKDAVVRLRTQIAIDTVQYNHIDDSSITYIHNSMYNDIFGYIQGIYSKNYQFYWYGHKKNIYYIVQAVTQNVIDYHGIAKYQFIMMQWFISAVYIKMSFILKKCQPLNEKKISEIEFQLLEISNDINALEAVKKDFEETVKIFLGILKMSNLNTSNLEVDKFNNVIKKKLELFDFDAIEAELTVKNVCPRIKKIFGITNLNLNFMSINLVL